MGGAGAGRRLFFSLLCLSAIVAAPALEGGGSQPPIASCSDGVVSRLYLGQATPNGEVTEEQWRAFINDSVTPRFPAGFTQMQAQGQWRDDRGKVMEEDTRIIEIAHEDSASARARVRALAADYQHRFAQQSVLVTQFQSFQCL